MRSYFLALLLLAAPLSAGEVGALSPSPSPEGIEEAIALPFYDGIVATVERKKSRSFRGVLTRVSEDGRSTLLARYLLLPKARQGLLIVPSRGVVRTLDYSEFRPPRGEELEAFLAGHTPASIALSMLVLWEDETAGPAGRELVELEKTTGLRSLKGAIVFRQEGERPVCDGCIAELSGCSPHWLVPNTCAGSSILLPCNNHDACYQCGAFCFGTSRAACDEQFRQEIFNATGSSWCANIYYWGVRFGGWPFYDDPTARGPMHSDVYSLGIEVSACEGQYAHLCTRYVM